MKSIRRSATPLLRHAVTLCLLPLYLLCTGCVSMYMTQRTNQEILLARTLQLRAQGGQLQAGIDLLALTDSDYLAAWKAHPWLMTGSTIADLGTGVAAYSIYNKSAGSSTPAPAQLPAVQSTRGDVFVIQGNNNQLNWHQEVAQ